MGFPLNQFQRQELIQRCCLGSGGLNLVMVRCDQFTQVVFLLASFFANGVEGFKGFMLPSGRIKIRL